MKCICKFAFKMKPEFMEVNSGEYRVEPNQAYSLQDIFEKFRCGVPINDIVRKDYPGEVVPDDFVDKALPANDFDKLDALEELNKVQQRATIKPAQAKSSSERSDGSAKSEEQANKSAEVDETGK